MMGPPIVIVFGSERLAQSYARQKAINPRLIHLATRGPDVLRGHRGKIKVVRYTESVWKPTTFPDEQRVKAMEVELRRIKSLYPDTVLEVQS